MRIVGFVLAILLLMMGIGSNLEAMVDPPSAIIVLGFVFGALLLSGADIPLMLRGIRPDGLTPDEAASAAEAWKRVRLFGLAAGGLGTIIGWTIMLRNMDDPAAIGPGLAISLLTLLYGVVLAFIVALPLQAALRRPDAPQDTTVGASAVVAVLLSAFLAIGTYAILGLSFGGFDALAK